MLVPFSVHPVVVMPAVLLDLSEGSVEFAGLIAAVALQFSFFGVPVEEGIYQSAYKPGREDLNQ